MSADVSREVIRIGEGSTRAEIERAITVEKARHDRMPKHWVDRRAGVMDDIEGYVDLWLAASS